MFDTRNDLPANVRTQVIELLNARLADAIDLGTQTKHAHWNVKGPNFIALHELFDQVAEHLEDQIDTIAERVTARGGTARGTLAAVARATTLRPYPEDISDGTAHVDALSAALAAFGAKVRAGIDEATRLADADSADLFTGVSRETDKDLWFLEAHLHAKR
ncbi:MAG: DNA starvation/stationary phase protection protein Dps [Gammaproteobacteria bacterium]|nr:MAG: DNA starvation/stationary phase protection protein Dps [Gammaproteobacteria bacterium]